MLVIGTIIGFNIFCSKKPTKPDVEAGLRLYVADCQTTNLYVIDPLGDSVLDSIPEMYPNWLLLTRDGKWFCMMNQRPDGFRVQKYDAVSLDLVGERAVDGGYLAFVEREKTLLRAGSDIMEYIDPQTFAVVDIDSIRLRHIASADTVSFIVATDTAYQVICYAFGEKRFLSAARLALPSRPPCVVNWLSLAPSGREGYAIMHDSPVGGWFVVIDTPSLELKYWYRLQSFRGEAAPSPDGRYVLVTDPGDLPSPPTLIGDLFVYDVAANEIVKVIHTDTLTLTGWRAAVSQMAYSPDGKLAFISTGSRCASTGPVLVFDMEKLAFIDRVVMPHEVLSVGNVAAGPAP